LALAQRGRNLGGMHQGTPQGGVVSPILANLFLHYAFDAWMTRTFPGVPWCRYADDGLIHCQTETQAYAVLAALTERFAACGLAIHPDKTHIVYCKDGSRKEKRPNTKFDFLGYTFRPRVVKNRKRNSLFVNFTPAVSAKALKARAVQRSLLKVIEKIVLRPPKAAARRSCGIVSV
jgi:RNA-directed DNA polymerase